MLILVRFQIIYYCSNSHRERERERRFVTILILCLLAFSTNHYSSAKTTV
uniref:Uncharacterized protein n=1 Tax=Arundo donax TaxID=35708 RepID=A0A0A9GKX1_ARUDO